jgi:amidase
VNDLWRLSAIEQASLIRSRKLSSPELVEAHLEPISRVNPGMNAAIQVLASGQSLNRLTRN